MKATRSRSTRTTRHDRDRGNVIGRDAAAIVGRHFRSEFGIVCDARSFLAKLLALAGPLLVK